MGELRKLKFGQTENNITPYTAGDNTVIIDGQAKTVRVNTDVIARKGEGGGGSPMEETTWAALKAKRDGGQLTPGMQYRITDYVCTTTQAETRAVSHPFDIIVVADDENTLNENARACLHEGDNYYSAEGHQADLEAWELKYCIDNDDNRFAWADTANGKGIIYYMKDDRDNECSYDFKQIQFKRYPIVECAKVPSLVGKYATLDRSEDIIGIDEQNPVWCYTFSVYDSEAPSVIYDGSIALLSDDEPEHCCFVLQNKINPLFDYEDLEEYYGKQILYLNNIVFACYFGGSCGSNTFGDGCHANTFVDNCYSNTFGFYFSSNAFGNECHSNTFGDNCNSNTFGKNCGSNTLGDGFTSNTLGDGCIYNTFGTGCQYVDFATGSHIVHVQYYHILDGVQGSNSSHVTIPATEGNNYVTYIGKNSSGVLKTWVPADLAQ